MPNWCFNGLTVEGNSEQVKKMMVQLNKPFKQLHDSWDMTTHTYMKKNTIYSEPVFAFHNIYNYMDAGIEQEVYMGQTPRDMPIDEQMLFKTNDWYAFNVREWGTKWDVAVSSEDKYPDTNMEEYANGDNHVVHYNFNTAWSPPFAGISKLSAQYPTLLFTLSYEEETGWGGECEFLRGEKISESDYSNKCRDCDSEDTLDYCENDCGEICSSCNYMGEADLEAVAECQTHKIYLDSEHVPDYRKEALDNATRSI